MSIYAETLGQFQIRYYTHGFIKPRRDPRPENEVPTDAGCVLHPSCLSCPRTECVIDQRPEDRPASLKKLGIGY